MSEIKSGFSQEYTVGMETSVDTKSQTQPLQSAPISLTPDMSVEVKRYGSGKPQRVIIRAKLTDD